MPAEANGLEAGGDVEAPAPREPEESPVVSKDDIVKVGAGN